MEREKIEWEISQIRSKYGEKILNILKEERTMYHGDLAARLSVSPSGLNAVIKKMQGAEIPLLNVEQIGKFRKYSLSEAVRDYMDGIEPAKHSPEKELREDDGQDLFIPMQRFVEAAYEPWRECLNRLLCGEEAGVSRELQEAFEALMKQMEALYVMDNPQLDQLRRFIKNEVVVYLLDQYLEELR